MDRGRWPTRPSPSYLPEREGFQQEITSKRRLTRVPDISATSEMNLVDAWNGEGAYASDHRQRRNYRIIALVQQPNFLLQRRNPALRIFRKSKTESSPPGLLSPAGTS
jgi:hypothetical protein